MYLKSGSLLQGGKYQIERVLGKGGFGITYLAVQTGLNRKVAVKEFFMKEHCNRDESSYVTVPSVGSKDLVERFRQKFIKEAQTIAEMDNQHIVRVYDIFEENATAYYVMEYLHGGDLKGRIPASGLPESLSLSYIRQISSALSYIHKRNVLHLDIKPSNVLFRDEENLVLIDFGISKHYDESGCQTSSTPAGVSKGYAPLEQYNQGIGNFMEATDVYSLAATLYKLLTGNTPPEASIVNEDGLPELPPVISPSTADAIKRGMQPRRKDRPQTVDEFLDIISHPGISDEETEIVKDKPSKIRNWELFYKIFFPVHCWKNYSVGQRWIFRLVLVIMTVFLIINAELLFIMIFWFIVVAGLFVFPFAIKNEFDQSDVAPKWYWLTVVGTIMSLGLSLGGTMLLSNIIFPVLLRLDVAKNYKGKGASLWLKICVMGPSLALGGCALLWLLLALTFNG